MIDFAKDNKFFSVEEQLILNHLAVGVSKDEFFVQLDFSMAVCSEDDTFSLELLQNVKSKVQNFDDEQWEQLQQFVPFPIDGFFEDEPAEML